MSTPSTSSTIAQLNSARSIVLKDAAIYPQVVTGVLPVIGPERPLELRRWGADFLAETFASPVVSAEAKQSMIFSVLDTLKSFLLRKEELGEEEDSAVIQGAVQCAASVYPLVFRHTVQNQEDGETWAKMAAMKSSILKRMDTAPGGVRICCIKFVARVVQAQTAGLIADPRRPEQNEISLALVPRDHKLIPPSNLEAEASGLLDRLLGVLQDNLTDPLIVTATLNALASLVQRRASVATKILSTVLGFNPLALAGGRKLEGREKVAVKSMTRTTMSFLTNVLKRNPTHALAGRIQQKVEMLRHVLTDVFSDHNPLKRSAPDEPTDGLSEDKRQKLDNAANNNTAPQQQHPPLPSGPVSIAQLWTLTPNRATAGFHVEAIPAAIIAQLVPPLLTSINPQQFEAALNIVKSRYLEIQRRPPFVPPPSGDEEDDDYDPDTGFGDGEQVANQMDQLPPINGGPTEMEVVKFEFPPPQPLTEQECAVYLETAEDRLFTTLHQLDTEAGKKVKKGTDEKQLGFNQPVPTAQERDGWIAMLTRLVTRPTFKRADSAIDDVVKIEGQSRALVKSNGNGNDSLPDKLRAAFHTYILDDWRRRLDIAIAWLSEEWYAEKLSSPKDGLSTYPIYTHLTLSLLDALLPYIDTKDGRHLIRFLSEIPYLPSGSGVDSDYGVWSRIEVLARDPERVGLAAQTLLYLAMLRPPVREGAVGCAERIWRADRKGGAGMGKVLQKYRPEVLVEAKEENEAVKAEGEA